MQSLQLKGISIKQSHHHMKWMCQPRNLDREKLSADQSLSLGWINTSFIPTVFSTLLAQHQLLLLCFLINDVFHLNRKPHHPTHGSLSISEFLNKINEVLENRALIVGHNSEEGQHMIDQGVFEQANAIGGSQGQARPRNDPFAPTYN
ncbi:hypothetical protein M0R45_009328 [Rubus argutus]|uniref:Uncharacterized protein n=1 Tax=Rubus argutus TaxID=59490 RepID=A0AAW1Y7K8_RUBAR